MNIPEPFTNDEPNPDYIKWMQQSDKNYHSDRFYINSTVIKKGFSCLQAAVAHVLGIQDLPQIDKDVALMGTYFHTRVLEPKLVQQWLSDNQEDMLTSTYKYDCQKAVCDKKCSCPYKLKSDGTPSNRKDHVEGCDHKCKCPRKREIKKVFQHVDTMVDTLERHRAQTPELDFALKGDSEVVLVAKIAGVWCKAKLDKCLASGDPATSHINDLKSVANFHSKWDEDRRARVSWYDSLYYTEQLAFYREIFAANYGYYPDNCYLTGISKETIPDIQFLNFKYKEDPLSGGSAWNLKLDYIGRVLDAIDYARSISDVHPEMHKCGTCKYCRITKVLDCATIITGEGYGD